MSNRATRIKSLEKRAFYQRVLCPRCQQRLVVERTGRHLSVPDAACIVDNGECLACLRERKGLQNRT